MKISGCPGCNGRLTITEMYCPSCDITIKGKFSSNRFGYLDDETLGFIEIFLLAKGNIKELEKILGISYPTVKARIDRMVEEVNRIKSIDEEIRVKEEEEEKILKERQKKVNKMMTTK